MMIFSSPDFHVQRRSSTAYIVISVLTLLVLLFFYSFLYMYQRYQFFASNMYHVFSSNKRCSIFSILIGIFTRVLLQGSEKGNIESEASLTK